MDCVYCCCGGVGVDGVVLLVICVCLYCIVGVGVVFLMVCGVGGWLRVWNLFLLFGCMLMIFL